MPHRCPPPWALWGLLASVLLIEVALSLDCYSHEGTYVQALVQPNVTRVTCGPTHNVCVEQMLAMTIVGGQTAVLLRAGCKSEYHVELQGSSYGMLPFVSSSVRVCISDLCNDRFLNSSLPFNVPPEATANATDVLRCYSCLGLTPESCSGENMDVVPCPPNFPRCAIGMASATIDVNYMASFFYRSCQDSGAVRSTSSTRTEPNTIWETITRTVTAGCHESLCNDGPLELPTPPPRTPHPSLGDWHHEGA
ncbi:ly6/PLAUR domain-containing protein 3-like [Alligator mississippiensis]|uniref:Ly6/PLAUR domain-containing protein 3-like n=1 Tax=Alligator mississippiensis TaxID=8496 RepID=A0A151N8B9_ALLMI|nr:ly6/PLAUR domain-containing protein 3-like [Alligator mississippiensis]